MAFPTVDENFAAVRLIETIQQFHRSGFARAVFADDAVDRAALDREVYSGIRDTTAKSLREAAQFDCGDLIGRIQTTNEQQSTRIFQTSRQMILAWGSA